MYCCPTSPFTLVAVCTHESLPVNAFGSGSGLVVGAAFVFGDDELAAPLLFPVLLDELFVLPPPRLQPMAKRQNISKVTLRLMDDFLWFKVSPL